MSAGIARGCLFVAIMVALGVSGSPASEPDKYYYYLDTRSFSIDAIRFLSGESFQERTETPGRSVLVVYRGDAKAHSQGVAYFTIDQKVTCSTQAQKNTYTAYADDGAVLARSDVVPPDALKFAREPVPFDWGERCKRTTGKKAVLAMERGGPIFDQTPSADDVNEAVKLARQRDVEIDEALRLPQEGDFIVIQRGIGVMLLDAEHSVLSGGKRLVSWIFVQPSHNTPHYIRSVWTIDCDANTAARRLSASFDDNNALIGLDDATPDIPFSQLGYMRKFLSSMCQLHDPEWTDLRFKTLSEALTTVRSQLP